MKWRNKMGILNTTYSTTADVDFINDEYLGGLIDHTKTQALQVQDVIAKSLNKEALSVEETAVLLRADDRESVESIFSAARQLKREIYGNRIVLFAPLYVGNYCINDCAYCAFKRSNRSEIRRTLSQDELRRQVLALESVGHKRLILVFGEHSQYTPDYIASCVKTVYETKHEHGEIRRVNINAAPLDHEGYRIIKEAGIGTYQVFQETYHHDTYRKVHPPDTRKGDYLNRLHGVGRAMEAGCDDVGIGALFGLYDWRFEALGLVSHAQHLQETYGVGPHTISFPRLRPAFGVSQIDAGSRIEIGGYTESGDTQGMMREQFTLGDVRSLDEVMRELLLDGYIPSFCTSCYRLGRTGEHFMEYAIPGFIQRFCTPNGLTTLQEYLQDYASNETRKAGENLIADEVSNMPDKNLQEAVLDRLQRIKKNRGKRLLLLISKGI
jgi:2-iminoacetate synthase